ncbi:hypothetical protein M404DRAFT_999848 [Pisolithus tinctorius Marx 270]|uniref:Uncharacterized protein n=1 Tax=Pisolithus tinctorius Marx 270 TaxID=870435 RepID=A0A0C3PBC8_PISTI|nr:hypothetical protein M404DRAFT_999848 [Pisolithus tinctorius Marx 270]
MSSTHTYMSVAITSPKYELGPQTYKNCAQTVRSRTGSRIVDTPPSTAEVRKGM